MLTRLLPPALLLLSACHPNAADEARQRRLQALTHCLELANEQKHEQNLRLWAELSGWAEKFQAHSHDDDQALARLQLRCDTIRVATNQLRVHLQSTRRQLLALVAQAPGEPVTGARLAAAARLFTGLATYRHTLRATSAQVVLSRLGLLRPAADTTAAALANSYFGGVCPPDALAALAQLEAAVLADEATALQEQNMMLSCRNVWYTDVGVRAVPDSAVVVAGQEYRASLSLVAIPKPPGMTMRVNDQPIPVMPDGVGRVRFVADPRLLGTRAEVTAYWTGTICTSSLHTYPRDTTYKVRVPYRIVRGR